MPWQRLAADVIGEVDEAGLFRHRTVVMSVPRQSGKTALMGAVYVHRCLIRTGARVWHTQQTGQHARETWRKLVADQFEPSMFAPLGKATRSAGSEVLRFQLNRAQLRPHPPTADALHGEQSDLCGIDEAWTFDEDEGRDLLQAIIPTQATRPGAQTIIYSTRGTADGSTWFHNMIDRIVAGESRAALIDYGIPDDAPADVDTVVDHHPAVGHTIGRETVVEALDALGPSQFARAYGNRTTATRRQLIPSERLDAVAWNDERPDGRRWVFAAAVSQDRGDAAIAAATVLDDGRPLATIVQTGRGSSWVAPRLVELVADWDTPPPVVDRVGPAATVADALDRMDEAVEIPSARDVAAATADLLDRLQPQRDDAPGIWLHPHPALMAAISNAATRPMGDAIMLSRRGSAGSVAAFEAVILAVAASLAPAPDPVAPMIWN